MDMFGTSYLVPSLGLLAFSGAMIWAGMTDVRSFTITNRTNLTIAISFFALSLPMGMQMGEFAGHFYVGLITFSIAILLFFLGIFGGGDAKLMGAAALWLGPAAIQPFVFYTALSGGLLALVLWAGRKVSAKLGLPKQPRWARRLLRKQSAVPYGVALAIGAISATPYTTWFPS
jgi:prepilin peptidase CpaA